MSRLCAELQSLNNNSGLCIEFFTVLDMAYSYLYSPVQTI